MKSPNGLNDLPVDTKLLTYGYGAEPVKATVMSPQREDGTYMVMSESNAYQRISPDDIVKLY